MFSSQSGEYNLCLVITTPAAEMYLHAIKIASIGSQTECVPETQCLFLTSRPGAAALHSQRCQCAVTV